MSDLTGNASEDGVLVITPALAIPRAELRFRTSRSGGPGGQHVNKVETKVELLFDLANSPSVTEDQRATLAYALGSWLDNEGVMHVTSEQYRSQLRNREDAVTRFVSLVQQALRPRKARRPTRVPRGAHEERLHTKKARGTVKRLRGRPRGDE